LLVVHQYCHISGATIPNNSSIKIPIYPLIRTLK
jgi:hypothetical protein